MLCRGEDAKHRIPQVASQQAQQAAAAKASAVKPEGVNPPLPFRCCVRIMQRHVAKARLSCDWQMDNLTPYAALRVRVCCECPVQMWPVPLPYASSSRLCCYSRCSGFAS